MKTIMFIKYLLLSIIPIFIRCATEQQLEKIKMQAESYVKQGHYHQAINTYLEALSQEPTNLYHAELGKLYMMVGNIKKSIEHFLILVKADPNDLNNLCNIGLAYHMGEQFDRAIDIFNLVLKIDRNHFKSNLYLPLSHLSKGDFEHGWHLKWLLKKDRYNAEKLRQHINKNTLIGKRILLYQEGGLGDSLQYIRYAKILHDQGAFVMAWVPKALVPLLSLCPYIDSFIPEGCTPLTSLCDNHTSIMSLPAIFHDTNEQRMGSMVPYLYADQQLVNYWKQKITHDKNFKIGLCWQADTKHDEETRLPIAFRSIPLILLARLAQIPGISFYCLQKGKQALTELSNIPAHFIIHCFEENFDQEHGAFMDTAALMRSLDLVITVDTSIAHLAGGLEVPVWLLLPYAVDSRWIVNRTDSPWYPTMRIFKQQKPFDWDGVVEKIYGALNDKIKT